MKKKKQKGYSVLIINKRRRILLGFHTEEEADSFLSDMRKVKGWKSGWTKKVLPKGLECIGVSK
jgi:hypothetical protein